MLGWLLITEPTRLWKESGRLIHELSVGKAPFSSNPHLGDFPKPHPYLGVRIYRHFQSTLDFSTVKATYPQIIASYPQNPVPEMRYGGFPCPYI